MAVLVVEPPRDMLGVAPLPFGNRLARRSADQPVELAGEARPVEGGGVGFLDPLDRAALHEQPLDRIERRQFVMARLQRPHLDGNAEQMPKEILDMRRQIDQQVGFARMPEPVRIAPRRHQPLVQRGIALGQMRDKSPVEAHEPVAGRTDRRKQARVSSTRSVIPLS